MFGIFRYLLALMVVVGHLSPSIGQYRGTYAVLGFYTLSGYLITLILKEKYGFSVSGKIRFILNRILRIYPTYFLFLAFSCALLLLFPSTSMEVGHMKMPASLSDWLSTITLIGLTHGNTPTFLALAWTLAVEVFYYIFMSIFLCKSFKITLAWFCFSCVYVIWAFFISGDFWNAAYNSIAAGSIAFSTGALLYNFRKYFPKISTWIVITIFIVFITHAYTVYIIWGGPDKTGFYASFILSTLVIVCLSSPNVDMASNKFKKIDKTLGNLSYPIYLSHYPVAVVVSTLFFDGNNPDGILIEEVKLLILSLPLIHLISYFTYYYVEERLQNLRNRIRPN